MSFAPSEPIAPRPPSSGDAALWPSPWPAEDAGPRRHQTSRRDPSSGPDGLTRIGPTTHPAAGPAAHPAGDDPPTLDAAFRLAVVSTMVVLREPGEVFLLGHHPGPTADAWVERIDPVTLEPLRRSPDLPGGPLWPGGMAAHADGSLHVVFGRHAHRLDAELAVLASRTLPRDAPYNSFVVLPDGHLVTKDFGGRSPHRAATGEPCEVLVLRPDDLEIVARLILPEPSVARLSADGDDVYAVGDTTLWRMRWDGASLSLDHDFRPRYRTLDGQGYGWDAVIDGGAAWFLDNGDGSDRYAGTLRGQGDPATTTAPLHLVRVGLATGEVTLHEICGLPGGLIANPPAVDTERGIAVGYDSANGVVRAFTFDDSGVTGVAWTKHLNHAAHPLRFAATGELVLLHHDAERMMEQAVVLDIVTGDELARVDTGSAVQSVVFGAAGFDHDVYLCSFAGVSRIAARRSG